MPEQCCEHAQAEHGQERDFVPSCGSKKELCLQCPGYEEPGHPNGKAWHRWKKPANVA